MDDDKVDPIFLAEQAKSMLEFTKEKHCTDFRLKAGGKTMHVHGAVISTHSEYFKSLCKSGMKEAVIEQSKEDENILSALVEFMYLGKTDINLYNVESLLLAADFTTLAPLKICCEKFMIENLNLDTLLPYHLLAKKAKLEELRVACQRLSREKFKDVVNGPWFLILSIQEARDYLFQDGLNVDHEDQILEAMLRWISIRSQASSSLVDCYAEKLFPCLRLPLCSRGKLAAVIEEGSSAPKLLKRKIEQYLKSKHAPSQRTVVKRSFSPTSTSAAAVSATTTTSATTKMATAEPSSDTEFDLEVLLVGGYSNGWNNYNVVFMDSKPGRSSFLTRLPLDDDLDPFSISVCAAPDGFIASGGDKGNDPRQHGKRVVLSYVKRFSITDQTWTDLPDMLYPCYHHGTVCVSNRFFTVGGKSQWEASQWESGVLSTVSMLDLDTLAWAECQSLETGVGDLGIAAVDTDILVIGWKLCCKYDTRTGKRTSCQPPPKECSSRNCTVAVGKKVFVLSYNSTLFMAYDVVTDQWSELTCPVQPVESIAMVFFNGRLVVPGGFAYMSPRTTGYYDKRIVQTYDIENGKWWIENKKIPLDLCQHTAIVAKVPHSLKVSPLLKLLFFPLNVLSVLLKFLTSSVPSSCLLLIISILLVLLNFLFSSEASSSVLSPSLLSDPESDPGSVGFSLS